jgi:hypothetical protein
MLSSGGKSMKKTLKDLKKLTLNTEVIKSLTDAEAEVANGGVTILRPTAPPGVTSGAGECCSCSDAVKG